MFLNRHQIIERLHKGDLLIDPILEDVQISDFSVDLRLGTSFALHTNSQVTMGPVSRENLIAKYGNLIEVKLGNHIELKSFSSILATNLEYIRMPANLAAIIFPRSVLSRLGLSIDTSLIHPGYGGKLVFLIKNMTQSSVRLIPGTPIIKIIFGHLAMPSSSFYAENSNMGLNHDKLSDKIYKKQDLKKIEELLIQKQENLKAGSASDNKISYLLHKSIREKASRKGKILEDLASEIIQTIKGLKLLKRNARLKAEEIDLLVRNDITDGCWRFLGSPIIIECKNWSDKVGAREISILFDKMHSIGPDTKTAILIAPNGISGHSGSGAMLKIREKRQDGRYIILLDGNDLNEIANGRHAAEVIEKKYEELFIC